MKFERKRNLDILRPLIRKAVPFFVRAISKTEGGYDQKLVLDDFRVTLEKFFNSHNHMNSFEELLQAQPWMGWSCKDEILKGAETGKTAYSKTQPFVMLTFLTRQASKRDQANFRALIPGLKKALTTFLSNEEDPIRSEHMKIVLRATNKILRSFNALCPNELPKLWPAAEMEALLSSKVPQERSITLRALSSNLVQSAKGLKMKPDEEIEDSDDDVNNGKSGKKTQKRKKEVTDKQKKTEKGKQKGAKMETEEPKKRKRSKTDPETKGDDMKTKENRKKKKKTKK